MNLPRISSVGHMIKANSLVKQAQLASRAAQTRKNSSGFQYSKRLVNLHSETPDSKPPLVILLPWLNAREKHISKYVDYYIRKGYDTLVVTDIKVMTFLWPNNSFAAIDKLHEELKCEEYANRPLIVHSWSVGSYMLAVLFHRMATNPDRYADVSSRVIGCIADSLTIGSPDRMVSGIATTISKGPLTKYIINSTVSAYLYVTRPWTVDVYEQLVDIFFNSPLKKAPILYFYSHNDPMLDVSSIKQLIEHQEKNGYEVYSKCWQVSAHAQHIAHHPQEYTSALTNYLMVVDPSNKSWLKSAL